MRISVILAHPDPASLNHAIADEVAGALRGAGHDVAFHDLYREGFDPILPAAEIPADAPVPAAVMAHCREIAAADGIVVVHPNWWGQPPAILTGWVDRVMRPGIAYRFREGDGGEGVPEGLLRARTAIVLNTSNTVAARERAVFGDPLRRTWADCIFGLCGVPVIHRRIFGVVVTSTPGERAGWIAEAKALAIACFPPGDGA